MNCRTPAADEHHHRRALESWEMGLEGREDVRAEVEGKGRIVPTNGNDNKMCISNSREKQNHSCKHTALCADVCTRGDVTQLHCS